MSAGKVALVLLLLLSVAAEVGAFTHSCQDVKNNFIGASFDDALTYACVVPQEGFTNFLQLARIHLTDDNRTSFADIASTEGHCVAKSSKRGWILTALEPIDCSQEFAFVITRIQPYFALPLKQTTEVSVQKQKSFVVPQTGTRIRTKSCAGDGKVTASTGAGIGPDEFRYDYRSWTCAAVPDWIVSFDNVFTITVDTDVVYTVETSSDVDSIIKVAPGDSIAVLTSGRSNDQQNLQGLKHQANIQIDKEFVNVTINMELLFDPSDYGSIEVRDRTSGDVRNYWTGRAKAELIETNYFEVRYVPKALLPTEIYRNQDNIIVEISIGGASTTVMPVQTTSGPAPVSSGSYCNCDVDKFGMASGWEYNDIWLDIVVVLDTSEAMSDDALEDAGALIESFISDGFSDFLITDATAPFYARVGVIAMSDNAKVLYNLNMTKADKVQGKVSIAKGVTAIDLVDALNAAKHMLASSSSRPNTRQVVYYITDSNPYISSTATVDQFKAANGVIIVNNFVEEDEVERPGLVGLASDGYYFLNSNYMEGLQAFCKANCFCKAGRDGLGGTDAALTAPGGCYHPTSAGVPFNKAKTTCANEGGILATVHDDEKGRFLQQLIAKASSKSDFYWIGYEKTDQGSWQWEDQSTDPYTNWDVNEPSSAAVAKCAYVDTTTNTLAWGAGNCQLGFPYVCQYTPCSVGNKNC